MIEKIIEFSIRNRFVVILLPLVVVVWGVYAVINTPVDAIPDLSENQVIVFTDWMGRSPREIEDQITYPLSVNLQGLAGVKAVRSSSEFNFSMINVIFDDNVDFYFARQRVLERLTLAGTFLPPGVMPYLAPDATALGQIFWYTVEGEGLGPGPAPRRSRTGTSATSSTRCPAWPRWPPSAAIRSSTRSTSIPTSSGPTASPWANCSPPWPGPIRRSAGKVIQKGNAEYIVRGVGWIDAPATSKRSSSRPTAEGHAGLRRATSARSAGAASSAAACWKRTATRRSAPS